MYGYRNVYQPQDQRFFGLGLGLLAFPFLGGLAGGLLGGALAYPRPIYWYPPVPYAPVGFPPFGYPGMYGPFSGVGYPYY